ncbi:MAG: PilZ domain-containing protein [Deltaproteobacteria bacterium]|nr:PilZ domain-containing protein [Deltaproteobacteria bacterium]
MYKERRRFRRIGFQSRCWCEGRNVTLYVQIRNASLGGLFIKTHTPFNPGDQVRVRWGFPGTQGDHEAVMEVVWKRDTARAAGEVPGMGLKFISVPEETAGVMREFIGAQPELDD